MGTRKVRQGPLGLKFFSVPVKFPVIEGFLELMHGWERCPSSSSGNVGL